jgi:hypothetical protein
MLPAPAWSATSPTCGPVRGPYLAFADRAGARVAVAEYIEVFCNRTRLHSTLGYRTPFDAFTDYQSRAPSRCHF